jgi:hypothetical protein
MSTGLRSGSKKYIPFDSLPSRACFVVADGAGEIFCCLKVREKSVLRRF